MKILALDPSTNNVGWCILDTATDEMLLSDEMKLTGDLARRLDLACTLLTSLIVAHQPDAIYTEKPFCGPNGKTTLALGKLWGALWATAGRHGHDLQAVTPAEAKRAATGKGNASKAQVQAMIQMQVGRSMGEHACDAVAVCLAAAGQIKLAEWKARGE
jgi:crossover junction endodeoxyribonuclease RuvC